MKDFKFVSAEHMTTLEHYIAALLSSMISLQTLESFHLEAHTKGLLEDDENETRVTICWEIRRLMALYRQQVDLIMERCDINEGDVLEALAALTPELGGNKEKGNV